MPLPLLRCVDCRYVCVYVGTRIHLFPLRSSVRCRYGAFWWVPPRLRCVLPVMTDPIVVTLPVMLNYDAGTIVLLLPFYILVTCCSVDYGSVLRCVCGGY